MKYKPYRVTVREWDFSKSPPMLVMYDRVGFATLESAINYIKVTLGEWESKNYRCKEVEDRRWVCYSPPDKHTAAFIFLDGPK